VIKPILILLSLCAFGLAQGRQLTVERIYGPGQASLNGRSITVQFSPDGKLAAFLQDRGLWAIDTGSGERRELVPADKMQPGGEPPGQANLQQAQQTGLGRAAAARYLWSPDSSALILVRRDGLHWLDLKSLNTRLIVKGAVVDPKFSPDGKWLSFVRDYDLWVSEAATGKERRLTEGGREELMNGRLDWVYPEELDLRTASWWAPDSSAIAYLQMDQRPVTRYPLVNLLSFTGENHAMRYPKAGDPNPIVRAGVVSVKGGRTAWMDTGAETDVYLPRVNWLPDSRRLAIQRLNRAQNRLDVLLAGARDGKSQVLFSETHPQWVDVHDALTFLEDGRRFLWLSDRDGFAHLYLYDISGKPQRQITSGKWEVTELEGVEEKIGAVYFTATEKSDLERHFYRASLAGGAIVRISKEDGTHNVTLAPDLRHYVDSFSDITAPARQDLYRVDGTRVGAVNENKVAELSEYAWARAEFFRYPAGDGSPVRGMLLKPPGAGSDGRRFPVIVYVYGGPHAQQVRNAWGGSRYLFHQMMVQKGFVVAVLDNRAGGPGSSFKGLIHQRLGETELADLLAGVNYLKSLPYVDGSRLGLWGWSYGGYMTLYSVVNAPELFAAAFAGAPVTDWRQYDTIYTERYMLRPQDNPEGYRKSAPSANAANLKTRLLIAHGTGDDNVHFANSIRFLDELIKAGKYANLMLYPQRGHGVGDPPAQVHLFRKVARFFEENLGSVMGPTGH
jgi:dipeptidyl-peptidase-4